MRRSFLFAVGLLISGQAAFAAIADGNAASPSRLSEARFAS
jgi:hypothetical protein